MSTTNLAARAPKLAAELRQCACGAVYSPEEYAALAWRSWPDLGLELAECACGSTMSRAPVSAGACAHCGAPGVWQHALSWLCEACSRLLHLSDDVAEHRRAEAEDVAGEERAERARAWADS